MKILIVEDAMEYISIYRRLIERMGHKPIVTTTGIDAVDVLAENQDIGVIILDLHLPDFDGIDLCKLLHKSVKDNSLYILLITGEHSNSVHREGLDAGADDFLTKPVDLGILESRLKVGVRTVETNQELRKQRKRAELLLRENELYTQGFDESHQPSLFTDKNGIITHVNQAVVDFYGYSKSELIGQKTSLLSAGKSTYAERGIDPSGYNELFAGLWSDALDPNIGYWDGYLFNNTKAGETKEIHLRINNMCSSQGELLGFGAALIDVTDLLERERAIRYSCYHAIVDLAEVRDNETGEHLHRISQYSVVLSEKMELSRRFIIDVEQFAAFHDIGKVGVPDSILLAPRKLSKEEFGVIMTHPKIGYDILCDAETLEFAAEIAYTHHEKYNGKGYPRGLKGEDIPMSGRIIALADVYDALRSQRPYKTPWDHERVVELITSERGEHFDPQIVDAFLEISDQFLEISERYL